MMLKTNFLSPMVDQLTMFVQVTAIQIVNYLFNYYRAIDRIDPNENAVKMMGAYNPEEPLAQIIWQLEKGKVFARSGAQNNSDAMMVSKMMTLLEQKAKFNEDMWDW